MTARDKSKVNPVFSLASGTLAGAVEGFATYPIEYTKTVSQFSAKPGKKVRTVGVMPAASPDGDCASDGREAWGDGAVQRVRCACGWQCTQGRCALPLV